MAAALGAYRELRELNERLIGGLPAAAESREERLHLHLFRLFRSYRDVEEDHADSVEDQQQYNAIFPLLIKLTLKEYDDLLLRRHSPDGERDCQSLIHHLFLLFRAIEDVEEDVEDSEKRWFLNKLWSILIDDTLDEVNAKLMEQHAEPGRDRTVVRLMHIMNLLANFRDVEEDIPDALIQRLANKMYVLLLLKTLALAGDSDDDEEAEVEAVDRDEDDSAGADETGASLSHLLRHLLSVLSSAAVQLKRELEEQRELEQLERRSAEEDEKIAKLRASIAAKKAKATDLMRQSAEFQERIHSHASGAALAQHLNASIAAQSVTRHVATMVM